MMKMTKLALSVVAASLILATGCYDNVTEYPDVPGYLGLVDAGWDCFESGDYEGAIVHFNDAIDMDVTRPDAYLGAGWCSILLSDYWLIGDQYDYMAVQTDDGTWPVETHSVTMTQDLPWTTFQCVSPQLTADDYFVINSWGATDSVWVDTTLVFPLDEDKMDMMDNYEIGIWLRNQYGVGTSFQYMFEIADPNVETLFTVYNGFSLLDAHVDSIVNLADRSQIYINVPYKNVTLGDFGYRTWCMYDNDMVFTYATYSPTGGITGMADDAVAAYGTLQHIRGANNDPLMGCAALLGIADQGAYSFEHYDGINTMKLRGMAASIAFDHQYFRYALSICRTAGRALDVNADDPDFLVELMYAIEGMLM